MPRHTPAPWVDGNVSDAIVAKIPLQDGATASEVDAYHYYGGDCICESVRPRNKAIIKAAPDMLAAIEDCQWGGPVVDGQPTCPQCCAKRSDGHTAACALDNARKKARGES